jgi:15-cis-phytoene synthase
MKELFDEVSEHTSRITTRAYSTSFSLGIRFLGKDIRQPIYSIYGFVRYADEIVDSFHGYQQSELLKEFHAETYKAIERKISTNPILNSFQKVVHRYNIPNELIDGFMQSMVTDLHKTEHSPQSLNEYIYGSAEVVGMMCLKVFTNNNDILYSNLEPFAQRLGSAFQKVNFLRDLQTDSQILGRTYFSGLEENEKEIKSSIEDDFRIAIEGIKMLPSDSGMGVYLAYIYYKTLYNKIKSQSNGRISGERIRIPDHHKLLLMLKSLFRYNLNLH